MSETETPMMNTVTIQIMVVTMHENKLWQRSLTLPTGATIEHSLRISGYLRDFPSRSIEQLSVGVFGKHLPLHHPLEDHDRVEIYAPLRVDPKIARRRRAAHREKVRNIKKKMPVNDLTQSFFL
jgi:putative ubiquitin-RnfH superfamily antitoxin RatB of RatAB toxin-antitoxin module